MAYDADIWDDIFYDDFAVVDDILFSSDMPEEEPATMNNVTTANVVTTTASSLSLDQERVLSVVLIISATLSILGSSSIIFKILRDGQLHKPYHRTMFALSVSDVVASITFAMYPFLMPKGVRIWTVGNDATCTALGFFTQLSFVAIGYNCILSSYYLLAVRFNMKRKPFSQKYEKPMHFINIAFFLISATIGSVEDFYSPVDVGFGCWVNDWPKGCDQTGDCVSQTIAIAFAGMPVSFFFIAIVTNNLIVYLHVRTSFKGLQKVYDSAVAPSSSSSQGLTAREAVAARLSQRRSELYDQKLQEVAFQAVLYVGSFLICYTPALGTRLIETFTYNYDDAEIYWLLVITTMTLPLQGFFNMFIYNRPHYVRIREANPCIGVLQAMHAAFLESKSLKSSWHPKPCAEKKVDGPHQRENNNRTASSRFSTVGGALEVVEEEGSQLSEEDAGALCVDAIHTENTATDNESTINETDHDVVKDDDALSNKEKVKVASSAHPTTAARVGNSLQSMPPNTRQLDPHGSPIL